MKGGQQGRARFVKLFHLPAHARPSFLAGYIDQAAAAYFGQLRQQPARTAIEGCLPLRPQVQQRDEQIGRHTQESVNVQFLIGPVKLGSSGEHARIFQIAKRGFHFRLATISLNDLRRAPLGAIRNQKAKSEEARDQPLILLPVAPETDAYRSLPVASNFIAQQLTKVLVATDLL